MSTRSIRHVQLIVTGDLERKALEAALRRAFSGAQRDADVWQTSKAEGATTETLRLLQPGEEPVTRKGKLQAIEKLADRLVTSVWTTFPHGRGDKRPDLVLAVDDLELANIDQPEIVIDRWRQAVENAIQRLVRNLGLTTSQDAELRQLLRDRASFHLLVSMVESYFFGDPDPQGALEVAGLPSAAATSAYESLLHPDVERFEVAAPLYPDDDPRHPKQHLAALLDGQGVFYQETKHGVAALNALRWDRVPHANNPEATPFLRALFEDLADFFGASSPLPSGTASPLTWWSNPRQRPPTRLLRNL